MYGQIKKRRLRLSLITSRLSRPYSAPPTYLVNRGSSKIAIWAKQKALGRGLLRKAAILNRIRQLELKREIEEEEDDSAEALRQALLYATLDERSEFASPVAVSPNFNITAHRNRQYHQRQDVDEGYVRQPYAAVPPSPLGLSNYDALDEDDFHESFEEEEGSHDYDEAAASNPFYSDFNVLEPTESVIGDWDGIGAWGIGVPPLIANEHIERPTASPSPSVASRSSAARGKARTSPLSISPISHKKLKSSHTPSPISTPPRSPPPRGPPMAPPLPSKSGKEEYESERGRQREVLGFLRAF